MASVVYSGTVVVKYILTAVSTPDPCWSTKVISSTLFVEGRPVGSLDNRVVDIECDKAWYEEESTILQVLSVSI